MFPISTKTPKLNHISSQRSDTDFNLCESAAYCNLKMICFRIILCLLLPLLWGCPAPSNAANSSAKIAQFAVLEDKDGSATIDEISTMDPARFSPLHVGNFSGGFSSSAWWFRFTVVTRAGEWWLDLMPAVLDDLRLFESDPDRPGAFLERRAGDLLPLSAREMPYRGFVFKLHHTDDNPRTYYLRLKTTSSNVLNLRIWSPEDFFATATIESGLIIASLAILLVVLSLSISASRWLQDPLTFWFQAYLLSLTANFLGTTGLLQQYLTPEWPELNYYWVAFFAMVTIAIGSGFYRRLFEIDRSQPVLFWLYELSVILPLASILPSLLGYFEFVAPFVLLITLGMVFVGFTLSFAHWQKGAPGGAMLLLANGISLTGILVFVSNLLGLIEGGFLAWHSLQVASLGSIVALQIVMDARQKALLDERGEAEEKANRELKLREQQGRFIDLIGHEYRTPLAVMQTNIDILSLGPNQSQHDASIARMKLALSRFESVFRAAEHIGDWGKHRQIAISAVSIRNVLDKLLAEVCSPRVRVDLADVAHVAADPSLLETILRNLLDNALKYALPDATITIRLRRGNHGDAIFTIENPCVSPVASAEELLEKRRRGTNSHDQAGLGIGLYLVTKLVEDLNGKLQVDTSVQGRFSATISLPTREISEMESYERENSSNTNRG